ncbi:hypothetical protein DY000_02038047 [Brassica cretica]|uniref:Uncharacterized protein n=1 Tax=Brassica cretica TaxID=69181 RepID=A0ABQ7BNT2_BRACR|nr:hypothetical protein DY000_02038047 [Brassica cretica]
MGMETEFSQVRHARKRPEQHSLKGGPMRSNDGRDMVGSKIMVGSKTREVRRGNVREEIRVSNRFGGPGEEGETEESLEDSGKENENKENENSVNWEPIDDPTWA